MFRRSGRRFADKNMRQIKALFARVNRATHACRANADAGTGLAAARRSGWNARRKSQT